MAIKLLKQNLEYFRHSNNIIKAEELDNRVNDIVNYLNNEIIFNLNNLNDYIIVGSLLQNDINSILKSKSDVGYYWKKIDNNDFLDNSINLLKLNYKTVTGSIFRSDSTGNIELLSNQNTGINTIVCYYNDIRFDKINNQQISNLTKITGSKIKYNSINADNLINITPTISNNIIIGSYFKDQSITLNKIADNSLKLISFTNDSKNLLRNCIWKEIIPINFINLNSTGNRDVIPKIWSKDFLINKAFNIDFPLGQYKNTNLKNGINYNIPITKFDKFYVKNIIQYYCNKAKITDLSLTDPKGKKVGAEKRYVLSTTNIKPNSINPNRLFCWFTRVNSEKCYNINNIIVPNTIEISKLTPAIIAKIG
jgi:hypothetical protein